MADSHIHLEGLVKRSVCLDSNQRHHLVLNIHQIVIRRLFIFFRVQVELLGVFPLDVDSALLADLSVNFGHRPAVVLSAIVTAPLPNRVEVLVVEIDEGEGVRFLEHWQRHQSSVLLLVQLNAYDSLCEVKAVHTRLIDGNPVVGEPLLLIVTGGTTFQERRHVALNIEAFGARLDLAENFLFSLLRLTVCGELLGRVDALMVRVENYDAVCVDVLGVAKSAKECLLQINVESVEDQLALVVPDLEVAEGGQSEDHLAISDHVRSH